MKNLGICAIILILGVLGPQDQIDSPFAPVWMLGLLVLLAFLCQQWVRALHLPALVGWLAAGLVLGPSGLHTVDTQRFLFLQFFQILAGIWLGFQVGIGLLWPQQRQRWRIPALLGGVTLATFLLCSLAIGFSTSLPWWMVLLFGALASLWGPFAVWTDQRERNTLPLLRVAGDFAALIVLSAVLLLLHQQDILAGGPLVGRLWLALLAGALTAELLYRLHLFAGRTAPILTGLSFIFALAALAVLHLHLYALPFGFGAGFALVLHRDQTRQVRQSLAALHTTPALFFFALAGATLDLRLLWPLQKGFYEITAWTVLILMVVRTVGPAVWNPLLLPASNRQRHIGWLLLPRGALLFELLYQPAGGMGELVGVSWAPLLHQVALADMLIYTLVFSSLALLASGIGRRAVITAPASASAKADT